MATNYPLPSKASLVQQFVGKTLKEIPLPAAVIDIAAVKRNCERMSNAVEGLGFDFVPLVNTHKTTEIARLQIGDDPEHVRVLVTTILEAENLLPLLLEYQKEGKQVLYGVPVPPSQVERLANIARILGRRGGNIRLLVEHTSQIPLLQQISQLSGYPVYVYIHVDFGDEVCGVRPGSQEFQDLFSQMEQIILQEGPISLVLPGFYCHMEDSEIVFDPLEVLRPLNKQLSGLLNASPVQNVRFSVNATAAISHVSKLLADEVEEERPVWVEALRETLAAISEAEHLIEVHDGAYPLMDLNALARSQALGLGKATSRDLDDVALTILTEVCCIYTKREQVDFLPEEGIRGEALISLGSETLGQEPSKLLYLGYGLVGQWNIAPELRDNLDNFSSFQVSRVAPECGVLVWDGPEDYVQPLRSGQRLRVYPNDATKASESFGWYVVIDSSRAGREDEVVDIFVRWKG